MFFSVSPRYKKPTKITHTHTHQLQRRSAANVRVFFKFFPGAHPTWRSGGIVGKVVEGTSCYSCRDDTDLTCLLISI